MPDHPPESSPGFRPPLKLQPVTPRPADADDDEPLGGDPPCWSHLFFPDDEDEPAPPTP